MIVCVGMFFLLTLLKINGLSIAVWDQYLPSGNVPNRTVLYGTPKPIRMDEWAVSTPGQMSQYAKGYPLGNTTVGGEKLPLTGGPTAHFSALFKPNFWGHFFLDVERGMSWYSNFKAMGMLITGMFLLLILTGNNFWLSLFGSVWMYLSAGTQWWFSITHPEMFTSGCALFVCLCVFLYSKNPKVIMLTAALGVFFMMMFLLLLYPPYQVPFGYFLLVCAVGFMVRKNAWNEIADRGLLKIGSAVVGILALGVILYFYYQDAKSTYEVLGNTVYPGKRSELGGTGFVGHWFVEFYSWWLSDTKHPQNWLNICELSHTLNFIPIVVLGSTYQFVKDRKVDYLLILLGLFLVVNLVWILVGFPEWLAKLTLYNTSPTRRTQIPFGLASVVFTVLYIDYVSKQKQFTNNLLTAIVGVTAAVTIYLINVHLQQTTGSFFKFNQLLITSIAFIITNVLLFCGTGIPYKFQLFCVAVLLYILPNFSVNPINRGLSAVTEHPLYMKVREIQAGEPNAKWVVIGNQYISYMVSATGVDLLSGVKGIPDFPTLHKLDPSMKQDSAYNRYAHTAYYSYIDGTNSDTVIFRNNFEDAYSVGLDPCSPKLKAMNVRYFIFDKQPQPVEVRCMKLVTTLGSINIYRSND